MDITTIEAGLALLFSGVVATFTAVLAIVAIHQLKAMKSAIAETIRSNSAIEESNRIASLGLELGHRAWLAIVDSRDDRHDSIFTIRNLGKIPAKDVRISGEPARRYTIPPFPDFPDTLTIGGGESVEVKVAVNRKVRHIVTIEYADYFGKKHTTKYFYESEGQAQGSAMT